MKRLVLSLLLIAGPAFAQDTPPACPEAVSERPEEDRLLAQLAASPTPALSQAIANQLWQRWLTAPDDRAQAMLDRGIERREAHDLEASEAALDELVAYCPDYAEAYNQRAFSRFLRQNYEGALDDLNITLENHPSHFGALSGKFLSLMGMGRTGLAQESLRAAVKVHPWLNERAMLAPEQEL